MEQLELEGIADAIVRAGGQDEEDAPKLAALVRFHLGPGSVDYAPTTLPGDAALVRIYDDWRIYVRRGLSVERRAFAIAHELAEWWLRVRENYSGGDVEGAANYLAAAVMSPRRAFQRALSEHGSDFVELARAFRTTETQVALREAELAHMPRAVISPALVRVRGPEAWVWPEESVVRGWARRPMPGLQKTRLTDDPKRMVIDVDESDVG